MCFELKVGFSVCQPRSRSSSSAHRARYDDCTLQRQWPAFDAAMQMFGHETVAGENDLIGRQADRWRFRAGACHPVYASSIPRCARERVRRGVRRRRRDRGYNAADVIRRKADAGRRRVDAARRSRFRRNSSRLCRLTSRPSRRLSISASFCSCAKCASLCGNHKLAVALRQEIDIFFVSQAAHQVYRVGLALVEKPCLLNPESIQL